MDKNVQTIAINGNYIYANNYRAKLSDFITSVKNYEDNSGFKLYPNPVTDFINIRFTSSDELPNNDRVQIFNTLGVEVANKSLTERQEYHKIDISHLPTGVYFVKINNKMEKFVKI